ncbi:MAG TPA: YggT family protein [Candidatus Dormibacteraeota bacterium]|nr:YggT family protein [Candidatus Dormibacteraeota bacterium]
MTASKVSLLGTIAGFLSLVLYVFIIVLLVRVVFSWISPFPTNPVSRLAFQFTEPVLAPVRRRLPPMSGVDLSPLVVTLAAYFLIALLRTIG